MAGPVHIRTRSREGASGFTILELLIVMAIMGLVIASSVRGVRSITSSDLRTSSSKLAGAVRYLFDRASATGRVHRLVIDFDKQRYWAEVSDDRFLIARDRETEETRQKEAVEVAKEQEEEKHLEELKQQGQTGQYNIANYQPKEFRPKRARFAAFNELAIKGVTLNGKSKITSLYTPRLASPLTAGRGYLYFFPLGQTEPALIHLTDKEEKKFYSLIVHPLTGRVQVRNEYIQEQLDEQYDDEGLRIDQ